MFKQAIICYLGYYLLDNYDVTSQELKLKWFELTPLCKTSLNFGLFPRISWCFNRKHILRHKRADPATWGGPLSLLFLLDALIALLYYSITRILNLAIFRYLEGYSFGKRGNKNLI
jgi:hypothetical protein